MGTYALRSTFYEVGNEDAALLNCRVSPRTPSPFSSAVYKRLSHRIKDLMCAYSKVSFEGIGISLPGQIDLASSRLTFAPNLRWSNMDFKTLIEQATGLPVELENAANACALAEPWSGRHSESVSNIVVLTVPEDIGVGMVMNDQLPRGSQGVTGELGHLTIGFDGPLCRYGNHACWAVMASNAAGRYQTER